MPQLALDALEAIRRKYAKTGVVGRGKGDSARQELLQYAMDASAAEGILKGMLAALETEDPIEKKELLQSLRDTQRTLWEVIPAGATNVDENKYNKVMTLLDKHLNA